MKEKIVMKMVLEIMITSKKESFITKDIKDSIKLNFGYDLTSQNISSIFNKLKETTDLIKSFPYDGRGFQYQLADNNKAILYYEELKTSDDVKNSLLSLISKDEFNISSQILGMFCSGRGSKSERMNMTMTGIIRFIKSKKSYTFTISNIVSMFSEHHVAITSNINYMRKIGMIVDVDSGFLGLSDKLKSAILRRLPIVKVDDEPVIDSKAVSINVEVAEYIVACQKEIKRLSSEKNVGFEELNQRYQNKQLTIHKLRQENLNLSQEINRIKNHYISVVDFDKKIKILKDSHEMVIKEMVEKFDNLSDKANILYKKNKQLTEKRAEITLTSFDDLRKQG